MATGKARREAADNVGWGGGEVAEYQTTRFAGPIPSEGIIYFPFYVDSIAVGFDGELVIWHEGRIVQSVRIAAHRSPQFLRDRAADDTEKAKPKRQDKVALGRGMGKAAKGTEKGKPATGAVRKVHPRNRTPGK